jgi:gallate dioxygenase
MIYNDHVTSFFFDHYSAFALGVGPEWPVADEGAGARDLPSIKGHPQLASHIGQSPMADEFDMAFFQHRALDPSRAIERRSCAIRKQVSKLPD